MGPTPLVQVAQGGGRGHRLTHRTRRLGQLEESENVHSLDAAFLTPRTQNIVVVSGNELSLSRKRWSSADN
jgi:hypothetical protein